MSAVTHRQLIGTQRGQRAAHRVAGEVDAPPAVLGFATGGAAAVDALPDDLVEDVQHARLHRLVRLRRRGPSSRLHTLA